MIEINYLGMDLTVYYDDDELVSVSCQDNDDFFDMLNENNQQLLCDYFYKQMELKWNV